MRRRLIGGIIVLVVVSLGVDRIILLVVVVRVERITLLILFVVPIRVVDVLNRVLLGESACFLLM